MNPSASILPAARAMAGLLLLAAAAACPAQPVQPIQVQVHKSGQRIVIDVEVLVEAPVAQAWAVFTDYDGMPSFLKNVSMSKVLTRDGHTLIVEQAGATRVAFMTFEFHAVRKVEMVPMREIRSSMVKGDFEEYAASTTFAPVDGHVRVRHHGEYVPRRWLPPLIGAVMIESETKKQYAQFVAEVMRRAAEKPPARGPAASAP